eukprot:TRINITY_DN29159_c1_g2_i2.p1 TRINITY_DN29159_c1_g2~~TRINITY_DN29159_c1_g2_i2.p1  ORF type:complete len:147 (+),score=22.12 TRINITY_DN29159_c1_g2_i2:288-728(+)
MLSETKSLNIRMHMYAFRILLLCKWVILEQVKNISKGEKISTEAQIRLLSSMWWVPFSAMAASVGCLSNKRDTDPPVLPSQKMQKIRHLPIYDSSLRITSISKLPNRPQFGGNHWHCCRERAQLVKPLSLCNCLIPALNQSVERQP